jgi:hypothetical protein
VEGRGLSIMSQGPEEREYPIRRSSENITPASGPDTSSLIDALVEPRDRGPSATSAAALEFKLEDEQTKRRGERYIWIFVTTILVDCILFKLEDSVTANLFISIMSVILLIGCARWLEVYLVNHYLDRVFSKLIGITGAKPDRPPGEES